MEASTISSPADFTAIPSMSAGVVPHFERCSTTATGLLKNYAHAYESVAVDPEFARVAKGVIAVGGRGAQRPRARRLLRLAGRRHQSRRRWRLLHLDSRRSGRCAQSRRAPRRRTLLRHRPRRRHARTTRRKERAACEIRVEESCRTARARGCRGSFALLPHHCLPRQSSSLFARLERTAPFIDKTVYTSWNAMATSAYLHAGRALNLAEPVDFALKTLDRILAEGWSESGGLAHVISYADGLPADATHRPEFSTITPSPSKPASTHGRQPETYATTRRPRRSATPWSLRFCDSIGGAFFDAELPADSKVPPARSPPAASRCRTPAPAGNPLLP